MQTEPQIHFHGLDRSPALEAAIQDGITSLEDIGAEIVSCQVTVERPGQEHRHGNPYHLSVCVHVAGEDIVVSHDPTPKYTADAHEDPYLAVKDVFATTKRRVRKLNDKRRDRRRH